MPHADLVREQTLPRQTVRSHGQRVAPARARLAHALDRLDVRGDGGDGGNDRGASRKTGSE